MWTDEFGKGILALRQRIKAENLSPLIVSQAVTALATFATIYFVGLLYGLESLAAYVVTFSIVNFGRLLNDSLLLNPFIIQYATVRRSDRKQAITLYFAWINLAIILVSIFLFFFLAYISKFSEAMGGGSYVIIGSMCAIAIHGLIAQKKATDISNSQYVKAAFIEIQRQILLSAITFAPYSLNIIVEPKFVTFLPVFGALACSVLVLTIPFGRTSKRLLRTTFLSHKKIIGWIAIEGFAGALHGPAALLLMSTLVSPVQIAIAAALQNVANLLLLPVTAVSQAIQVSAVRETIARNAERLQMIYRNWLFISASISTIISVILITVSIVLFDTFFKFDWRPYTNLYLLFLLQNALISLSGVLQPFVRASGLLKIGSVMALLSSAVTLFSIWASGKEIGLNILPISRIAGSCIIIAVVLYLLRKSAECRTSKAN